MQVKIFHCLFGLLIILNISACKEIDSTFKDYVVPGGIVYAGKPINPVVHPGYNRAMISWLRGSDPNVVKAKIFWNNYADSLVIDIPDDKDTIDVLLNNLPEKYYSFYIITYDEEGHSSVVTEVLGAVYGEKLRSSLLTRPVLLSEMNDEGKVLVTWGAADVSNGAFAVDIFYTDKITGSMVKLRFDVESLTSEWDGDPDAEYFYQTAFLPDTLSIDTLFTDLIPLTIQKVDVTNVYLKNAKRPFAYTEWDGSKFGILRDWITNDAVKNKGGMKYGGFDNLNNGASLGAEQWTGDPPIVNGKIYQTFTAAPGNYTFTVFFGAENPGVGNYGNDPRYLVVAAGNTLPDVSGISSALASVSLVGVPTTDSRTINFSVTEPTEVSLGILVNFTSSRQNLRVNRFQLFKFN
ncbi:MAG: DUF4998 domain-containing protein [Mangrovibacterium sp.]